MKYSRFSRQMTLAVLLAAIFALFASAGVVSASQIEDEKEKLREQAISGTQSSSSTPAGGIVVNCSALNVRLGAGTEFPIIGTLTGGAAISIIGSDKAKDGTTWWKIKYNGSEAFVSGKYIDTKPSLNAGSASEEKDSFTGTVNVDTRLNVRSGPWGDIIGKLRDGDQVQVISKKGNWYKIKHNGREAYVYSQYISKGGSSAKKSAPSNDNNDSQPSGPAGNMQQNIVKAAESLIGSTQFRGPEVSGGRLACAQFVSTALKKAGVLSRVQLGVLGVMSDLKSKGWKVVSAPPFKAGDVITWRTYDRNGDGRNDDDTHIGIIDGKGNAISNSSSLRYPRKHSIYYCPICHVLRKS